jgi:hypothetical protein
MQAVSLDAEKLSAAQSGLRSMEWVSYVCFRSKMFKLFHITRQHYPRLNYLHAKLSTRDKSGSEIRTPLIFHIRWRLVLNFTPKPRLVPPPPFQNSSDKSQTRYGSLGEYKNILPLLGIESQTPSRLVGGLVTILTEMSPPFLSRFQLIRTEAVTVHIMDMTRDIP